MRDAIPRPQAGDADRAPAVRQMFDQISPRYDLANRVLSLGLDQAWRRRAVRALGNAGQGTVLDLCAGTLDLTAMLVAEGAAQVHAVDFSSGMLEAGRPKLPPGAPVLTHVADATSLPLADGSVDGVICGFGIRNVPAFQEALTECARVLRPGGRLVILDFFQPEGRVGRVLQGSYNRLIVPVVGGWITGARGAYDYLFESIEAFTTRAAFSEQLVEAGFEVASVDLFPPVASLVIGTLRAGEANA